MYIYLLNIVCIILTLQFLHYIYLNLQMSPPQKPYNFASLIVRLTSLLGCVNFLQVYFIIMHHKHCF